MRGTSKRGLRGGRAQAKGRTWERLESEGPVGVCLFSGWLAIFRVQKAHLILNCFHLTIVIFLFYIVRFNKFFFRFEQMALRKVRSNLDRLFDKSLTDLIRGIRNNKDNEVGKQYLQINRG